MKIDTVITTRAMDLCVSCGICASICPVSAISMQFQRGQFVPYINENCTKCGICLKICPGIDFLPKEFKEKDLSIMQKDNCMECYTAFTTDIEIRVKSSSGGIITQFVSNLISNGDYDYVFVLNFTHFSGKEIKLEKTNDTNFILASAKSKYVPVSFYNVAEELKKRKEEKYIIIGTGCEIYGIKKFIKEIKLKEDNLLFLGLFCEKTLNFNLFAYYEKQYKKANEKISEFYFKNKEKNGWPGDTKIVFDSKREIFIDRRVRIQLKDYFQLRRCLVCLDKLNYYADISFGDCYIKGCEDWLGKSNIVIRSVKGREVFVRYMWLFKTEQVSLDAILYSQSISFKKQNILFQECLLRFIKNILTLIKWWKVITKIYFGQRNMFFIIKLHMFLINVQNKIKSKLKKIVNALCLRYSALAFFIYSFLPQRKITCKNDGKNVVIVGGGIFNKGAQSMTFTVVSEMKNRYPEKDIYLFSTDEYIRLGEGKELYTFTIMPWEWQLRFRILGIPIGGCSREKESVEKVLKNAFCIIDISGYVLSSQWGWFSTIRYLANIAVAKRYNIKYLIFPQSIGPFKYKWWQKLIFFPLLKYYFVYPKYIYVREEEGFNLLLPFTSRNISRSKDIVLQNQMYDVSNIYKELPSFKEYNLKKKAIGILPNQRIFERTSQESILGVYKEIIESPRSGYTFYILRHSFEDLEACYKIKQMFQRNENVILIEDDLSAIEFEMLVKKFDFIVGSRYHSIVHAYRNGVPAIVIGWATKYFELLKDFDQLEYFFDCRTNECFKKVSSTVLKMMKDYQKERIKILNNLKQDQSNSIFNFICF